MNPPADTWVVRDSRFIQHKLTAADFEVRRVKQLALGHQAKKWPRWDSNPGPMPGSSS